MDALKALEEWDRKYYRFKIETGGHFQAGDGVSVSLMGGGRTVMVCEEDITDYEKEIYPSIGDVILEAIRLWHADDSLKFYRCYASIPETFLAYAGEGEWQWWSNQLAPGYPRMVQVKLEARNEAEAIEKVKAGYPEPIPGKITVYETKRP